MRRFASVFVASRRSDKADASPSHEPRLTHKKSSVFHSLSRKHTSIAPPSPPPLATDLTNSASSSSSGSTTLRTPDDDGLPRTPSKKGSWKSWLGGKNAAAGDHPEEHRSPPWDPSQTVLPPSKADDASEQSDDPYGNTDNIRNRSYSPQHTATACTNARIMIMNSLVHDPPASPLLRSSDAISFPRSRHNPCHLRRRETLETELHKKSLLARLDRPSPSTEASIAPLALKPVTLKPQTHRNIQDDIFVSADSVSFHSRGLEDWVSRPCFEDRFQLWTCLEPGEIIRTRIPGSHLGVAALEFSEPLELLAGTLLESGEDVEAGFTFDPAPDFSLSPLNFNLDPPAIQMKQSEPEPLSAPPDLSQSNDSRAKPFPSPQFSIPRPTESEVASPVRQCRESATSGSAATTDPVPKRGVRFADDDGKDDQIPLGYVLRIRKNKEQKARFLREERERRERTAQLAVENRRAKALPQENRAQRGVAPQPPPPRPLISLHEPSKPKPPQVATVSQVVQEEERRRREVERAEMEKLRRSRELARKQAEERERAYIEELQATRARREAFRAGRPLESPSLSPRVVDRNRSGSRDSTLTSPGGSSMSHKQTPELLFSPVSPYEGSPSSSVLATPGSQYSFSRPPSIYSAHTASSEDVRGRDGKHVSRRMSVVSDPAKGMLLHPPYDPRTSFNPYAWTNVPPVPAVPPVPPVPTVPMVNGMPFYGMDMPLLPPAAPFMMNQFGARSRSYTALAGQQSPLQSSASLPRNYSSEGANSSRNSSPHSSGSHTRRSSDDARMTGDLRSGSYNKSSASMRTTPSQSTPRRLPPEQSSFRPVSNAYPTDSSMHLRRRTAAS